MSTSSAQPSTCPQCGVALPAEATEGLCPRCLFSQAMRPLPEELAKPKKAAVPLPEELAQYFPNYEILRILGRGGMGAVYLARQTSLNRLVAIKILPSELDDGENNFTQRFKNEAQAMAQLSHPGIVAVYDFGQTTSGRLYIVMEYIDGTDVALMVERQGRLPSAHAMAITAHVCDALAYAHGKGIIHRDIKPSNIMIGNDGVVKVADFGLAKMSQTAQSGLTQSGMVMGTLHFMAPEALMLGSAVDHRADIYAVGVMLYQMLTGKLPHGMFELPSIQVKGLDPRYDGIIAKAMREDRALRYQSAREMRHDLDGILTQPVQQVEMEPTRPVAVLPTDARPRRYPAGQPYRPPLHSAPLPVKKKSSAGLVLPTLGLLGAIGAALFFLGQDRKVPAEVTASGTVGRPAATAATATTELASATKDQSFTNSLGMKFVPVPIGGGPTKGQQVLFSIWDTRAQDYEKYAAANKGVDDSWKKQEKNGVPCGRESDHPVVGVSWEDAQKFCQWLTEKEIAAGKLPKGLRYRLPSDEEWSWAAGLPQEVGSTPAEKNNKNIEYFPWGKEYPPTRKVGNYADESFHANFPNYEYGWIKGYDDGYPTTSRVASFPANAYGLYDMGGNVWQWCEDWHDASQKGRVLRGASWRDLDRGPLLLSRRGLAAATHRHDHHGFRCVVSAASANPASGTNKAAVPIGNSAPTKSSNAAHLESTIQPVAATKDQPFINTLGMKFVPVPGTKVLFCIHETRRQDYATYANEVPSLDSSWKTQQRDGVPCGDKDDHPVVGVSWEDAQKFCAWLSKKDGKTYRLPTDEEWSIAVGVGMREKEIQAAAPINLSNKLSEEFPWGKQWPPPTGAGNFADESLHDKNIRTNNGYIVGYRDGFATTAPVMSFSPNELGLFDLSGNVWEICNDWVDEGKNKKVMRGGCWDNKERGWLRSTYRSPPDWTPTTQNRTDYLGFRVILANDAVQPSAAAAVGPAQATPPGNSATHESPGADATTPRIPTVTATKDQPFINTLGMKFAPVPGTKVLFSIWDTRVKDYEAYAKAQTAAGKNVDNAWRNQVKDGVSAGQEPDHPVVGVSWEDAQAFCLWLMEQETANGTLPKGAKYRLPMDAEWSEAMGMPAETGSTPEEKSGRNTEDFPWGKEWPPREDSGNYADETFHERFPANESATADWNRNLWISGYRDGFATTSPVGRFPPNKYGLYDMGGNIWRWCEDWWNAAQQHRVQRGGWFGASRPEEILSSKRIHSPPVYRGYGNGFRVVLELPNS